MGTAIGEWLPAHMSNYVFDRNAEDRNLRQSFPGNSS